MKRVTTKQALTFYDNEQPVMEDYFKQYKETGLYMEDETGKRYNWINYKDYINAYIGRPSELWAIGNSNWDLYKVIDSDDLYSIPKLEQAWQCQPSCFGTVKYVKRFEWRWGFKLGATTLNGIEY